MERNVRLRQRIGDHEPLLGAILRMPSEALVELAGLAGLDFVILDCEHGPTDGLQHHLTAAAATGLAALVRVSGESGAEIQRALDLGAAGIVVPHVDTPDRARSITRAAHYPPAGTRGFATYTRAGRYGLTTPAGHLHDARQNTIVVAMIEDAAGCQAATDIAATDGIDALFAGPADLAVALGHPGQTSHPEVTGAIARIHQAAARVSCAIMTIVSDETAARSALDRGTTLVVYNIQAAVSVLFARLAGVRDPGTEPPPLSASAHQ